MSATDAIGFERLEALLRGDAARTPAEERRAALLGALRGAELQAPEALQARVQRAATAPRRTALRRPPLRLALVLVPSVAAVAVGAAVVHGLVDSGGSKVSLTPHAKETVTSDRAQSKLFQAATPAAGAGGATSTRVAPKTADTSRLQHTDASLQVRVPDVDRLSAATSAATRIATSLGGYAQSVVYRTPQQGGGAAYLELRVPAQNVQQALARLAGLGTLVSQQVSTKDLQHQLEVQAAQIAQLRRSIAALQKALRDPALPAAQRVLLQIKLADQKRSLGQRLHAQKGTLAAGATARISLVLSTAKSAAAPAAHHRGRLGRMVHSAVGFLGLEATIALYALIVASPLVVVGLAAWGFGRLRRRRDERRLLAA